VDNRTADKIKRNLHRPGVRARAFFIKLLLSTFPGVGLLDRAFERNGFCVVRTPDLIFGGDIREFHSVPGKFAGVIGGSPCQDFSLKRRAKPTGYGVKMLREFCRIVLESQPDFFLLENVPNVPDIAVPGFIVQRFNLNAKECGSRQNRLRCFQFGSRDGTPLIIVRTPPAPKLERCCLASEHNDKDRRTFADFCELQGLPRTFNLKSFHKSGKYTAVGNGVPLPLGLTVARAIVSRKQNPGVKLCACLCGRIVTGKQVTATPACRKRIERNRDKSRHGKRVLVTVN